MWQDFSTVLGDGWQTDGRQTSEPGAGSYRADLHYMRGPGPEWHARRAGFLAADPRPMHVRAPVPLRCSLCAQPMTLVRTTQRYGGLPTLHTFECRSCDMVLAREAEPPVC